VAVGGEKIDNDPDAAAWTSADGETWTRVPHDETVFGGTSSQGMSAVVSSTSGVVAVGWDYSVGPESSAAVWVSADGFAWTRVPHDEAVLGGTGSQLILALTAGGPGLVAVGWDNGGGDSDAAVWTSVDGLTWSRVPHDEAIFGGDGNQYVYGVSAGGPGLVAVGRDASPDDSDAAVWTSPDGVNWTRVPASAELGGTGDQQMRAVVAGGPGLVAVGDSYVGEDGNGAVWVSTEGISWSRADDGTVFGGAGEQGIRAMLVTPIGLIAGGYTCALDYATCDALAWVSSDGVTWTRMDEPGAFADATGSRIIQALALFDGVLVAGGYDGLEDEADAAFWVWQAAEE
jgi:hypothetical protein